VAVNTSSQTPRLTLRLSASDQQVVLRIDFSFHMEENGGQIWKEE
jgi:hypothetical protein